MARQRQQHITHVPGSVRSDPKQGGVAAEVREAIAEGTASLLSGSEDTDDDPFADFEEDDDELEENELDC